MAEGTRIERLLVDETIENVVPQAAFLAAFDGLDIPVELVGEGAAPTTTDAVATYHPRPAFRDAAWVHCIRAGYDAFDIDAYTDAGVPLTNSTGIHGATVGELAVGCMLSLARNLHAYRDAQNDAEWTAPAYERPFTVANERCCVVGLGTIGAAVARRADALGMEVVGVRRSDEPVDGVDRLYDPEELHEAVADARFVVVATPHTPETDGLFSTTEFTVMREDAYLVNVARGPIVDEDALIEALDAGEVAGAALDVFETEPLPERSPLWEYRDVIVTPHKGSATNRYHLDLAELVIENLDRIREGEDLRNRVA